MLHRTLRRALAKARGHALLFEDRHASGRKILVSELRFDGMVGMVWKQ